jgi:hypothetical protein
MALLVVACKRDAPARKPRVDVTVLATADEDAAHLEALVAQWKQQEGHCVDGDCRTIALSTGGHTTSLAAAGYAATFGSAVDAHPPELSASLGTPDAGAIVITRAGLRFYVLGVPRDGAEAIMQRDIVPSVSLALAAVVVSDLCVKELGEILERNARAWPFLLVAVGRACGPPPPPRHIFSVLLLSAPDGLEQGYGKATLSFDQRTAALLRADGSIVSLVR